MMPASLEIYNEQMVERGLPVFEKRKEFLEQLQPKLLYYYHFIAEGKEQPELEYQSQLEG